MWMLMAAHGACERVTSPGDVDEHLEKAENALGVGDVEGLQEELTLTRVVMDCRNEPIRVPAMARFHRLQGIALTAADDPELALGSFASARRLEPDADLPVYPTGHPVQQAYRSAEPGEPTDIGLPTDVSSIWVDGVESTTTYSRSSHLVQVPRADTFEIHLLEPGQVPSWTPAIEPVPTRRSGRGVLFGAGGAALIGSASLLVANITSAQSFQKYEGPDPERLDTLKGRTNALAGGSIALGTAGVGLVIAGVVRR